MKQFTYVVTDPMSLLVRAGLIAKQAREYPDTVITLTREPETVKADQTLKVLALGMKKGDKVTLTCRGEFEQNAVEAVGELLLDIQAA